MRAGRKDKTAENKLTSNIIFFVLFVTCWDWSKNIFSRMQNVNLKVSLIIEQWNPKTCTPYGILELSLNHDFFFLLRLFILILIGKQKFSSTDCTARVK